VKVRQKALLTHVKRDFKFPVSFNLANRCYSGGHSTIYRLGKRYHFYGFYVISQQINLLWQSKLIGWVSGWLFIKM
jgi:hypothetical protein